MNTVLIRFHTDTTYNKKGFNISYQIIGLYTHLKSVETGKGSNYVGCYVHKQYLGQQKLSYQCSHRKSASEGLQCAY